jgi:hypothetical protein
MGPPYISESAVPTKRPVPMTPPILDGGKKFTRRMKRSQTYLIIAM